MKRLLTALVAVLFIGSFAPPAGAHPSQAHVKSKVILAELFHITEKLDQFGTSLQELSQLDPQRLKDLVTIQQHFEDDGYIKQIPPRKDISLVLDAGEDAAFNSLGVNVDPVWQEAIGPGSLGSIDSNLSR